MAEPFIGEVDLYGFNFVPQSWGQCSGAIIAINSNQALFSLLGTSYGGDGRTSFALPDLRGRLALSQGQHPGSAHDWKVGNTSGTEAHTMTSQELAQHTHTATFTASGGSSTTVEVSATTEAGDSETPSDGAYLATAAPPNAASADRPEKIYKTGPATSTLVNLGGVSASGSSGSGTVTVGTSGSNTKFSLMQTSLVLNYCIAMQGLFPSRN
jgi:microcystin-dependent protein